MRLASAVDTLLLRRASIDLANQVYKVGEASLQAPALSFALRTDSLPQDQPDSLSLSLEKSRLEFRSAYADLQKARYSLARLGFASEEIAYRADGKKPAEGFDPNHLALASVALETDTLCMEGSRYEARITHLAARDRSGLQLSSLAGNLSYRDTVGIVADVVLETPHSRIRLNGGLRSYLWSGQGDDGKGWYETGDIVHMDGEGFIFIRGRAKRFAKIGGEMVSLAAVEEALREIWPEAVLGVVAIPDPRKGEQLALVIDAENVTTSRIAAHFASRGLSPLWTPKRIISVKQAPLLGSGKFDYRKARDMAEQA